jgi:hypothetical protein
MTTMGAREEGEVSPMTTTTDLGYEHKAPLAEADQLTLWPDRTGLRKKTSGGTGTSIPGSTGRGSMHSAGYTPLSGVHATGEESLFSEIYGFSNNSIFLTIRADGHRTSLGREPVATTTSLENEHEAQRKRKHNASKIVIVDIVAAASVELDLKDNHNSSGSDTTYSYAAWAQASYLNGCETNGGCVTYCSCTLTWLEINVTWSHNVTWSQMLTDGDWLAPAWSVTTYGTRIQPARIIMFTGHKKERPCSLPVARKIERRPQIRAALLAFGRLRIDW